MVLINGYKISAKIYKSNKTEVYRVIKEEYNQPVILKVLKQDYPTPEELRRYQREYEILKNFTSSKIIKVYGIEKYQRTLIIVLEDFGAKSLKQWMTEHHLTLEEFLSLAIKITEGLAEIHQVNIIHKDLNPGNIVINPETGQVKIIDFGISSCLTRENPTIKHPNLLEGTLEYISPEQTGRMNHSLDYRTDFYSLGVTFYEMLTRKLPFITTDPLELVHAHLALQPLLPEEINPEIPPTVAKIIMKLMAKTPEERYQSALGIKTDLELCLSQLQATGEIENFTLGTQDICQKFQIPEKLYGREREIATLQSLIERISNEGTSKQQQEMVLVVGESGSGKTVLVQEIYQVISAKQGYFISGKFEEFKRNIPYSAIVSAFTQLIRQILTESEVKLNLWREKLLTALGVNAQVIIDLIPELELIIGKQPAVAKLEGNEAQNRFNLVFQNFLGVFTTYEHPIVMFLDDLQWIDAASLQLIELFLGDYTPQGLLLIGSYRNKEVTATHPLSITLEKLAQVGVKINKIILKPLQLNDISQLIADTLKIKIEIKIEAVKPLAELVLDKTEGNPFFVNEFLKTLFTSNLINFEVNSSSWQWEIEQIQAMNITANVVELMASQISKLPDHSSKILQLAACIGCKFDLQSLSIICQSESETVLKNLCPALESGLILQINEVSFKFRHDRIQQAAYSLIQENKKQATHLEIGRLLLKNTDNLADKIIDIVNHLNLGINLITEELELLELAQLNLQAAKKAKSTQAYAVAVKYLETARESLAQFSWDNYYELTLDIYLELAETEYLNTNYKQAETWANFVINQEINFLDKIKAYETKIKLYIAQNQMQQAIDTGLEVLNMLGVSLVNSLPENISPTQLDNLPIMTDTLKKSAIRISTHIIVPTYISNPNLCNQVILTMINLFITYGNLPEAAFVYTHIITVFNNPENINLTYQWGLLGRRILDKFQNRKIECRVKVIFYGMIFIWKQEVRATLEPFQEIIKVGLETGDIVYAGYAILNYCYHIFYSGKPLTIVEKEQKKYINLLAKIKQQHQLDYTRIWGQLTLNLSGKAADKKQLIGDLFNETEMLPKFLETNSLNSIYNLYLAKAILSYWFGDYPSAITHAAAALKYEESVAGLLCIVQTNFYYSLALLADEQPNLEQVTVNQNKMKIWANNAPMNCKHKYELIAAEKARVEGKNWEAAALYEQAIKGAKENQYLQEEALAYELAGRFYFAQGMEKIAQIYLQEAKYCYSNYAAWAKVKQLEATYPQFLLKSSNKFKLTTTANTSGEALDLATVLKASQAISSEVVLAELLRKLLKIIMENAGAQTGFLLLENKGELLIEAEGSVNPEKVTVFQSKPINNNLPTSIINYVARTAESLVVYSAIKQCKFSNDPYIQKYQPLSILCVPLINQGKLLSIVYLENNLTIGGFTPDRLEVIKILSAQAAISIENARLYQTLEAKVAERTTQLAQANEEITVLNELLKQENYRMSAELEVAQQLQKMVLPKPSELESIEELEIVGFMQPADEVGGDYYEVLSHNGRVIIGIGDVTGHGLASGVLMLMVQTAVRTLVESNQTNQMLLLDILNKTIYNNVERMNLDQHLTLAILDYQQGTLKVSGQHEQLIIVRSSGELELINTLDLGFPIGLDEQITDFLAEEKLKLNSGDVLVLYTDGVTEAEDINEVQYGLEKLCEVVRVNHQQTAEEIKQAIIDDLRQHIGQQKLFDDITFLVIKQK